jgi:hypothetical protein
MRLRPREWFVLDGITPTRIWGPYFDRTAARAVATERWGYVWSRTSLNFRFGHGRWQQLLVPDAPPASARTEEDV